jgi:hypothetical protein
VLPRHTGGDAGRTRARQDHPVGTGVHRPAGRSGEAGLRERRSQAPAGRSAPALPGTRSGLLRRRSVLRPAALPSGARHCGHFIFYLQTVAHPLIQEYLAGTGRPAAGRYSSRRSSVASSASFIATAGPRFGALAPADETRTGCGTCRCAMAATRLRSTDSRSRSSMPRGETTYRNSPYHRSAPLAPAGPCGRSRTRRSTF